MKAKGLGLILVILTLVIASVGGFAVFGAIDSGQNASVGASNLANYTVANGVTQAVGYNDSSGHWYTATLSLDKASGEIQATFAQGVHINILLIQTDNESQDVLNLINHNAVFYSATLAVKGGGSAGTAVTANLTGAGILFGIPVNSTNNNALADKGVTLEDYNASLYSSTATHLNGKTVQLNLINLAASLPTSTPQYEFWFSNAVGNGTSGTANNQITFTFTQHFEATSYIPVYTYSALIGLTFALIMAAIIYMSTPEHFGEEDQRAGGYYKRMSRRDITYTYLSLVLVGIGFVIIGVLGTITPLFGWGGSLAFLFGFFMGTWAYSSVPDRQKLHRGILVGFGAGIVLLFVNMFFPIATIDYNMLISGNLAAGLFAAAITLISFAGAYIGMINIGRYKLRERGYHKVVKG